MTGSTLTGSPPSIRQRMGPTGHADWFISELSLYRACLAPWWRWVPLWLLARNVGFREMEVVRDLASARNLEEVNEAVGLLHRVTAYSIPSWPRLMGFRMTGRRIQSYARGLGLESWQKSALPGS